MIENAEEYYELKANVWGGEYRWIPALKMDIETAKISWQDLKNFMEKCK
jgi:hypothetical protein